MADLQVELVGGGVGPNSNGLIASTGGQDVLFEAEIHPVDRLGVEGGHAVLELDVFSGAFQVDQQLEQLVVVGGEDELVFLGGQSDGISLVTGEVEPEALLGPGSLLLENYVVAVDWLVGHPGLVGPVEDSELAALASNDEAGSGV